MPGSIIIAELGEMSNGFEKEHLLGQNRRSCFLKLYKMEKDYSLLPDLLYPNKFFYLFYSFRSKSVIVIVYKCFKAYDIKTSFWRDF